MLRKIDCSDFCKAVEDKGSLLARKINTIAKHRPQTSSSSLELIIRWSLAQELGSQFGSQLNHNWW